MRSLGTWAGLLVTATGFALIGIAWGVMAGARTLTDQLPVLISVGGTGVALTAIGAVVVVLTAQHRAAAERLAQLEELRGVLVRLTELEEDR
jgi:hypothetical protein